ncbi:unnamed protein product [Nezara viridula]|uniref:Uncharacterized protein n=1 Tax=Nezara viridula TaxID=85310 RepID=A0A9P0HQ42_NEZVI|nr:unnamed protein product [Nezara viridula]
MRNASNKSRPSESSFTRPEFISPAIHNSQTVPYPFLSFEIREGEGVSHHPPGTAFPPTLCSVTTDGVLIHADTSCIHYRLAGTGITLSGDDIIGFKTRRQGLAAAQISKCNAVSDSTPTAARSLPRYFSPSFPKHSFPFQRLVKDLTPHVVSAV